MSVAAQMAIDPAQTDTVDLHQHPGVRAGTLEWRGGDVRTDWHRHSYHQLEYALSGIAEVDTPAGRYLLPPQQAIWIPAGLPHVTTLRHVHSVSVFFDPSLVTLPDDRVRVLAAAPVIREMVVHGLRWPIDRAESDTRADAYFEVLGSVVLDWLSHEAPLHLPTSRDPLVMAALDMTEANLATITAYDVCRAIGLSERTLRRRCVGSIGMTWRSYLTQSRLLRAAALLAASDHSVLDVVLATGFDDPSAFARAFRRWIGETPSSYRRRLRNPAPD